MPSLRSISYEKGWRLPAESWDAEHLAKAYFFGLEGDVRVDSNTIVVTYYNAPDADKLRKEYENLPAELRSENVDLDSLAIWVQTRFSIPMKSN